MAGRSTEDVKRDLESERNGLETAVHTLRSQAGIIRRRLPFLAIGAAGAGLVLRTAVKRGLRHRTLATEKRSRFSFRDGH